APKSNNKFTDCSFRRPERYAQETRAPKCPRNFFIKPWSNCATMSNPAWSMTIFFSNSANNEPVANDERKILFDDPHLLRERCPAHRTRLYHDCLRYSGALVSGPRPRSLFSHRH